MFLALLLALADARTVRAGGPIIIKLSDVVAEEARQGATPDEYADLVSSTARGQEGSRSDEVTS